MLEEDQNLNTETRDFEIPQESHWLEDEQYRQTMTAQGAREEGGEYFVEIPGIGKTKVELGTQQDAYFDYADIVGAREATVKKELAAEGAPVEEQIRVGRETMKKNESTFAEAKSAQDILDKLIESGQLLSASGIKHKEIPVNGLHYVLQNAESLKGIEQAFASLGYSVKKIPGLGIVVQGDSVTYSFLSRQGFEKSTREQQAAESDLDDDDDLLEARKEKRAGKSLSVGGKRSKLGAGIGSKGGSAGRGIGPARLRNLKKGEKGAGAPLGEFGTDSLGSEIILPAATPPVQELMPNSGINPAQKIIRPEAPLATPTTTPAATPNLPGGSPGGVATGVGGAGIGPIGPLGPMGN